MSDFSIILGRVRSNLKQKGVRHKLFTTTSNGATDGTTVISTELTELDDYWNNAQLISQNLTTQETLDVRTVEDFANTGGILSFTNNPLRSQMLSGSILVVTEKGSWREDDLKRFVLEAADIFLRIAPEDIARNFKVRQNVGGLTGNANTPANVLRYVKPTVLVDGKKCKVMSPDRASYLTEGAYLPTDSYVGYFAGRLDATKNIGQFRYRPSNNVNVQYHFIPVPAFDTSNNWKVPDEMWNPIVFGATQLALAANERIQLAAKWEQKMVVFAQNGEPQRAMA